MPRLSAAIAALAALGFGIAAANPLDGAVTWTHPEGLFSLSQPKGWPAPEDMTRGGQVKQFVMGGADAECWTYVVAREESTGASIARVNSSYARPLTADQWVTFANNLPMFEKSAAHVGSSVDVSGTFPVQTATLSSPQAGTVVAALHGRPGVEFWNFCASYDGKDRGELFAAIAKSLATPKDAEYAAQLTAPPAAPAPPPSGSQ